MLWWSELGCRPLKSLILSFLQKSFHMIQRNVLFVLQWLYYLSCLSNDIRLDQSFVRLVSIPVFPYGQVHDGLKLLHILVRVRQLLHPILLRKLLISFFLVDDHSFQFVVWPFLLKLIDFHLFHLFYPLHPFLVLFLVDAFAGPLSPPLLYGG